jgi:two-component system sensor histidine kinase VanS
VDRAPGLSVRLKLTLSYAGFLMLAGALMLAAVWVVVLRYIPDGEIAYLHPSWWFLTNRSDPLHCSCEPASAASRRCSSASPRGYHETRDGAVM